MGGLGRLGFEGGHGFGFCGGWGGEGLGCCRGCGWVLGTWLLPWVRWVLGELVTVGGC
uniref:Uncharacterized protein n=1 Tax=Fagus sylvatica TaxID=28930 RepID=A0A2N9EPS1_FAGSY